MRVPGREPRRGHLALTLASVLGLLILVGHLAGAGAGLAQTSDAPRDSQPSACAQGGGLSARSWELLCAPDGATPVAQSKPDANPDPDPLDGDPLDAPVSQRRLPDPDNAALLTVAQSGRQKHTPNSTVLYDGDDETRWAPVDTVEPWVWFDVGGPERLRVVRWLAAGSGDVEIAISADRKQWAVLETLEITGGWQEITLREDARYVRLTLLVDDDATAEVAEVEIYGRQRAADATQAQAARERDSGRERRAAQRAQPAAETEAASSNSADSGNGKQRRGAVNASAKSGKTKCSGKRERCRARPGKVEVTDDCGGNGSCTIDIRADGGSAVCDAAGGEENQAGQGEGKRGGGDGGRCEAIADGGSVTIGDINP